MNSLKKGEGVPLLNFQGGPGVPLLNLKGGPKVPLLNFRGVPGPIFKLWGGTGSRGPVSRGSGPTFTQCPKTWINSKYFFHEFKTRKSMKTVTKTKLICLHSVLYRLPLLENHFLRSYNPKYNDFFLFEEVINVPFSYLHFCFFNEITNFKIFEVIIDITTR